LVVGCWLLVVVVVVGVVGFISKLPIPAKSQVTFWRGWSAILKTTGAVVDAV